MAKRSISASASTSAPKRKRSGGHKVAYDPSWKSAYPWLVPAESDDVVTRLKCQWCTTHSSACKHSRSGTWTTSPCMSLCKDCIERHKKSEVYARSVDLELHREQAVREGGIMMAFQQQVVAQRKAVIGALKVVYWLAKEEIAYTTKYELLLSLAQSLGCTYLKDFCLGSNASYTSRQIIGVFAMPCNGSRKGEGAATEVQSFLFLVDR